MSEHSTRPSQRTGLRRVFTDLVTAWRHHAVRRGVLGSALLLAGALSPAYLPEQSPLRSLTGPMLGHWTTQTAVASLMLIGVVVLFDAWLRLRPDENGDSPVPQRAILAWWSLPMLAAPPLFSSDSFSYAAQGRLIAEGINPYDHGPWIGPKAFAELVDPLWLYTAAPYGPLSLQLNRGIVELTGRDPWWSAVLMRIPAVIGVVMIMWAVRRLARTFEVADAKAVWWSVLNPVLLMHFVGGSHNDSLMVGLGAIALVLATDGRLVGSSALLSVAALVKQPIGFFLPACVALALAGRSGNPKPTLPAIGKGSALAGAVFAAVFAAGTWVTQLGYGWIQAAGVPGSVGSLSPSTNLARLVNGFLSLVGVPDSVTARIDPALRGLVVAAGGVFVIVLAVRCLRDARWAPQYIVWGMLALACCLPALQVWYVLWGGAFIGLAAITARQERWVMITMVGLLGYSTIDAVFRFGIYSFVILAVLAFAWSHIARRRGKEDPVEMFDRTVGEAIRTEVHLPRHTRR